MKKIAMIVVAILITLVGVSQNFKSLQKNRDKEIKEIKKLNLRPTIEADRIGEVNTYYAPLMEKALELESQPATRSSKNSVSYGGKFERDDFTGRTLSTRNAADAYATVAIADANANLINSMASGNGGSTISASPNKVGLEGVIINKYRFYELEVVITGTSPGSIYNKTFVLGANQSVKDYLLPGTYKATVRCLGSGYTPNTHFFEVAPHKTHNLNGSEIFWGVWGGDSW